jgi:DNA-binding protein H-NS
MKTYQAVRAEIAKLEKQAEELRRNELKTIIAQVRQVVADYGLTAADIGLAGARAGRAGRAARKAPVRASRSSGVARYRDPKTGQTWTGRGRPPAWIAGAKDREAFLIDAPAAPAAAKKTRGAKAAKAAKPAAAPKKAAAKKRAAKPAARGRKGRAANTPAVEIESGVAAQ